MSYTAIGSGSITLNAVSAEEQKKSPGSAADPV